MSAPKPLRAYVVSQPTRGVQTYTAMARTAAEAARLADQGEADACDYHVVWAGKPVAKLDRPVAR